MRITRLTLRNWRNFKNVDVVVGDRLVIIGPNASGKSNLLDAVRFLRDIALPSGGLQNAVSSRGGLSRLRCLFARNNNNGWVSVEVELGDDDGGPRWSYRVDVKSEGRGPRRPLVAREVVTRDGEVLIERPDPLDEGDPERLTQTALEQISANLAFRDVADFLAGVRYLHLVPQVIRDSTRAGDQVDDPFGGDFIARMNRVAKGTRDRHLKRVTAALALAVPQFESLDVVVDDDGHPHLESRYTNWRQQGARQDERDMSDGTLRLIGLLWSLVDVGRKRGPVLLEEPELSLHPAVVRTLPSVLARAQQRNGVQVILTTHSPELLGDESLGADEVLLLTVGGDGTTATLVADIPEAAQAVEDGMNLADVGLPRTAPRSVEQLVKAVFAGA
ncbi:AAA family ATPase [Quadrisphaera setariae]|uniref:AAA family ATPase n=1 Tax=Quadrisphaera setariae TaxID=2593304 RepID=A0A5C8ZBR1_9ACTN|nr:ATP-binding protein [Quadrisphaera setariae]TXR55207.1 AAA family ATPase [Quadrisphaera setariae]